MRKLAAATLISMLTSGAFAQSGVESTTPAAGAEMTEVPADVSLDFANDIRLTRVDMTHRNHPTVTLDLGAQTGFRRDFTLPMQPMGGGPYRIEWFGVGRDGGTLQGDFTFVVD